MSSKVLFTGDSVAKQITTHYEKFLEKYAKEWDIDIAFVICHGKTDRVPTEMDFDKFYIFTQLLPNTFEGVKRAKVSHFILDGKKVELPVKADLPNSCPQGDTLSFTDAPEDAVIVRDDEGQPMAAVTDGSLYILSDVSHSRSKKEMDISMKLLDYIIREAIDESELLSHLKAGIEEKSRRALEMALKDNYAKQLEKEKVQLKAAEDTEKTYIRNIVECERKIRFGRNIISALQHNLKDIPEALGKTWNSIGKLKRGPLYENVFFTRSAIKGVTTPVTIKFKGIEYDMGRFEVHLGFNGDTKITALDNKRGNNDHPHVSNGNPCWGNMAGHLPKLIGSSEFDVAFNMVHTFLSSYDPGSPYHSIDNWPIKKEMKEEKKDGKA